MPDSHLAVVFDFDDTLAPDTTTAFLHDRGIDTDEFWRTDVARLVDEGYDPAHAYLTLILRLIQDGPLEGTTEADLHDFGSGVEFYEGIPEIFDDLRDRVSKFRDISIEFYIVSGGLQPIVEANDVVKEYFAGVYGCQLGADERGVLRYVKRCVTFTEKTRYLFEINKGISSEDSARNPYLVNEDVPKENRRIPFENMTYVGDGLTDIPCFSLLQSMGGLTLGVFHPSQAASAKRAFQKLLLPARVGSLHSPRYGAGEDLGVLIRTAVTSRCSTIVVERQRATS